MEKISHKNAVRLGIATERGEALEYECAVDSIRALHDESLEHQYWEIDGDGNSEWVD